MCNTHQCFILRGIVISVSIFCDANGSVAINQHNLFEYYVNYIGNLPFLSLTLLCSSNTLNQFRWVNRIKILINFSNSILMWVRTNQHSLVAPVILRIVYFFTNLLFISFRFDLHSNRLMVRYLISKSFSMFPLLTSW